MSQQVTFAEVIRKAMDARVGEIHTGLPGTVQKYDANTQRIEVQPDLKKVFIDDETEEVLALPLLTDVPVMFPRAGGFFITFPIVKGDKVWLAFSERAMDEWKVKGGKHLAPISVRKHDLSDAVAFPGCHPDSSPIEDIDSDNLVMGKDKGGMQIHVKPEEIEATLKGKSPVHAAIYDHLKTFWTTTFKIWLDAHVHPTGVGPSGPASGGATGPSPALPASVKSIRLKFPDN